jgi:hypothetical protein
MENQTDAARQLSGEVYRFACDQHWAGDLSQRLTAFHRPCNRVGKDNRARRIPALLLVARKAINFTTSLPRSDLHLFSAREILPGKKEITGYQ